MPNENEKGKEGRRRPSSPPEGMTIREVHPKGERRVAKPAPKASVPESAPANPAPAKPRPGSSPQLDVLAGVMGAAGSTVRIVQKAVSVLE